MKHESKMTVQTTLGKTAQTYTVLEEGPVGKWLDYRHATGLLAQMQPGNVQQITGHVFLLALANGQGRELVAYAET